MTRHRQIVDVEGESREVMDNLTQARQSLDDLSAVATNAIGNHIALATGIYEGLTNKLVDQVANAIGSAAETLQGLENNLEVAQAMANEVDQINQSFDTPADDDSPNGANAPDELVPPPYSGSITVKQYLWLKWKQYAICIRAARWRNAPEPEALCELYDNDVRPLERTLGLEHLMPVVVGAGPPPASFRLPSDSEIKITLPDGRVI